MPNCDVFLCYREPGAQTAKLFRQYLQRHAPHLSVWYSDTESIGHFKDDVAPLIRSAHYAVIFLSDTFTKGFSSQKTDPDNICITALEMVEIEKKLQTDTEFKIIPVFLGEKYTVLSSRQKRDLEGLFDRHGVLTKESISHFSCANHAHFNPRTEAETLLFEKLYKAIDNSLTYYDRPDGDFRFRWMPDRPTWVHEIACEPTHPISVHFESVETEVDFPDTYEYVRRKAGGKTDTEWDDDVINATTVATRRETNSDRLHIAIGYTITKYARFAETQKFLKDADDTCWKALSAFDSETPDAVFPLPNAVGLALMVVTNDHYLVFAMRSKRRNIRPREYDVSIVEGLWDKLHTPDGGQTADYMADPAYLQKEILRGYAEEISSHTDGLQIYLHGLILDKQYAQWNITGTVFTDRSREQLESEYASRTDKYEKTTHYYVECQPDSIMREVQSFKNEPNAMWDTALCVLDHTLSLIEAKKNHQSLPLFFETEPIQRPS